MLTLGASLKSCTISDSANNTKQLIVQIGELPHEWLIYFVDSSLSHIIPKDVCHSNWYDTCYRLHQNTRCAGLRKDDITIVLLVYLFQNGIQDLPEHLTLNTSNNRVIAKKPSIPIENLIKNMHIFTI